MDTHVISSIPVGEDVYGNMQFDTQRSQIGELMFGLKYRGMLGNLSKIMELISPFLLKWSALKTIDAIMPVPPTNQNRAYQPVYELALEISKVLGKSYFDGILFKTSFSQSKQLGDSDKQQISGTIGKAKMATKRHNMLLVDDIYDSGATVQECVKVLKADPKVENIYLLTMTKTKG
ncbi:MAG: ComF family protein [Clostridiales bacterium]|nr:ComF family protein [Clostridiales bacterium]